MNSTPELGNYNIKNGKNRALGREIIPKNGAVGAILMPNFFPFLESILYIAIPI